MDEDEIFKISQDTYGNSLLDSPYFEDPRNYYPDLSGVGDIGDPANYPRSETNPAGYDPSASYNQPLPKGFSIPKFFQDKQGNLDWLKLLTLLGAGYAGYKSKAPPSGGGVAYAYKGPEKQLTRTIAPGKYGPVAQFAAQGGIMQAYAQGGPVAMEDGGFVMTKKAVDGAGGPRGIQSLLPGARPIRGPGTGTSDSIPAYIRGRNTVTPARVSNGEAYVPRRTVQQAGGSRQLYNLMNMLQRRA